MLNNLKQKMNEKFFNEKVDFEQIKPSGILIDPCLRQVQKYPIFFSLIFNLCCYLWV